MTLFEQIYLGLMILTPFVMFGILLWLVPFRLIFKGLMAGIQVTPVHLAAMRFRQVNPHLIVNNAIALVKSGAHLSKQQKKEILIIYESHYLAGGNVARVTAAMVEAQKRKEPLNLNQAIAIDLQISQRE